MNVENMDFYAVNLWVRIDDQLPIDEQRLPRDGQRVLIRIKNPNPDEFDAATFNRSKIPKPGETICHSDQWGNNLRPYTWDNAPMTYFGQKVSHWKPIVSPEDEQPRVADKG